MKNKKALWIVGSMIAMLLVVYLSVPSIIRAIIASKAEGVVVKDISWSLTSLTLKNIFIDRKEAKGAVTKVEARFSWDSLKPSVSDIQVHGGKLTAFISKPSVKPAEAKDKAEHQELSDKLKELPVSIVELDEVSLDHNFGQARVLKLQYFRDAPVIQKSGFDRKPLTVMAEQVIVKPKSIFGELSINNVEYSLVTEYLDIGVVQGSVLNVDLPGLPKDELGFTLNEAEIDLALKTVNAERATIPGVGVAEKITFRAFDEHAPAFAIGELRSEHPWFTTNVKFISGSVSSSGEFLIDVGGVRTEGNYKKLQVKGSGSCFDWNEAIMTGVNDSIYSHAVHPPLFESGNIEFEIDPTKLKLSLKQDCKASCSNPLMTQLRRRKGNGPSHLKGHDGFAHLTYTPDGKPSKMRSTGRGHVRWASLSLMSPQVRNAFITLEDPTFNIHDGIVMASVIASFKQNIKLGKFHVGGSTITQQLAKNIWLTRDKNIVRKAKEALLAWALEDCFSKDEILELYLNVVEFGPNVYGIYDGAQYRFDKSFVDLTEEEAFYLASILPQPNSAQPPGDLSRTQKLMTKVAILFEDNE